jgi:signal transduction histidine kinase
VTVIGATDDHRHGGRPPTSEPRRRLRQRIARRVTVVATASVALVTAVVVPLAVRTGVEAVEATARFSVAQFVRDLETSSTSPSRTSAVMDRWMELNPDLRRVRLVGPDAGMLGERRRQGRTAPGGDEPIVVALQSGWIGLPWNPAYRTYGVVPLDARAAGSVVIAEFLPETLIRRTVGGITLLVLLLTGIVWGARTIARSLADGIVADVDLVRQGVGRIREGQLDVRIELDSRDEIQELAEAVNAMAETLSDTIDRLRAANQELETLDQTKADMVANVSHELKTPLTALRGYFELFEQEALGQLPESATSAVTICQKNIQRLTLRIDELVQLARLERDIGRPLVTDEVDLAALVNGVRETLAPWADEKQVALSVSRATDLEPIQGNAEQLERVFLNLVDNAVKFTPEGGLVRVVAEPLDRAGRRGAVVRVADTGVGIPERALLRIFDRFYQVDPSTRRKYGGMGLGLAVVESIVQSHRGAVWVESQPGRGSTFFVWLPRESGDPSASGVFPAVTRPGDE